MDDHEEPVLVLPFDLIVIVPWTGIKEEGLAGFEEIVKKDGQFKARSLVEDDPAFKQVIPYLVFRCQDKYWLMQRSSVGIETRLYNRYTLGIGGHVREEDLEGQTIMDWAKREFEEEINYQGTFTSRPLGLLNAEEAPVDEVHIGYVILLEGDSEDISIRENHKLQGKLLTLDQIAEKYEDMEFWSKLVFDYLKENNV